MTPDELHTALVASQADYQAAVVELTHARVEIELLKADLAALLDIAEAARRLRIIVEQRKEDEREWCAAGQTYSAVQLMHAEDALDCALAKRKAAT